MITKHSKHKSPPIIAEMALLHVYAALEGIMVDRSLRYRHKSESQCSAATLQDFEVRMLVIAHVHRPGFCMSHTRETSFDLTLTDRRVCVGSANGCVYIGVEKMFMHLYVAFIFQCSSMTVGRDRTRLELVYSGA